MYQKTSSQISFILPFGGTLKPDNRWVQLSELLPWEKIEEKYSWNFPSNRGARAISSRTAFGALIIKEILSLSDEETVEMIAEVPSMQYFLGFESFIQEIPFDPSMMVHFRKRFGMEFIEEINQLLIQKGRKQKVESSDKDQYPPSPPAEVAQDNNQKTEGAPSEEVPHQGKLILDATCAPADIHYPTDLALLNKAREKSEEIIDVLYFNSPTKNKKPRTYRRKARQQYLKLARKKKLNQKEIRKGRTQQLNYLKRNLNHIALLHKEVPLTVLSRIQYKNLLVIQEVYRQQRILLETNSHSISGRIVSIAQPHVRPIVRGKSGTPTEFGAKISASVCSEGFVSLDRVSWEAFNESGDLREQVEKYRRKMGYYPEVVLVDMIYRTRENRKWCKERGIRLSGTPLGRPPADTGLRRERYLQNRSDERERNAIEGKFGQAKRRFGLARIMAKLKETSESMIALSFLVMNLVKLRELLLFIFLFCLRWKIGKKSFLKNKSDFRDKFFQTMLPKPTL